MMREMTDRLGQDPELAAAYSARTRTTCAGGPSSAPCRDRGHLRRRHARRGSSACTCSSGTRSRPDPASTRSVTRRSPRCRSGGPLVPACPGRRRHGRRWGADEGVADEATVDEGPRDRLVTRVGAIDCGTNSIRLLVADVDAARPAAPRRWSTSSAGWRSCAWATASTAPACIDPEAMARTLAMAGDYAAQCEKLEVERVRFVATSASRDARNAGEFVDGVRTAFRRTASRPRWSAGTRRRRCRSAARPGAAGRTASTAPTSWSTSAAARPSSCAARPTWSRPGRSTSAASG